MLVRFIVKNLFSFKDLTEFNMLPGRFSRLPAHVYKVAGIDLLKLNVVYGANGAGKSNLIQSITLLRDFVLGGTMPFQFLNETFKFESESKTNEVYLGMEFIKNEIPYYYGLSIKEGIITNEELLISGLSKDDKILFHRTDEVGEKRLKIQFYEAVNEDKDASLFPSFLQNEILNRNQPALSLMGNRQNKVFEPIKNALEWFAFDLTPVFPDSVPTGIAIQLETNKNFHEFSTEIMQSFNTGIKEIKIKELPIEVFFGEENKHESDRIIAELKANPDKMQQLLTAHEEIVFVLRDNRAYAKRLYFVHNVDGKNMEFSASEESDGTRRLIDYLPALFSAIYKSKIYLIDEIERSIHPLLIKEIIRKFSHDDETKGQLIFTTHESNLLDQDIFRPDEIWFAEKNNGGATELSPLSEFKEHHTIDIRKGYLNGRYGGIPFLGNLKDLNWEKYAKAN